MTGLLLALSAAPGVFFLYAALVFGCRGMGLGPSSARLAGRRSGLFDWLIQAGLAGVDPRQFAAVSAGLAVAGAMAGLGVFGGPLPALEAAVSLAAVLAGSYRVRRAQRRSIAHESRPRIIEEIRIRTSSLGRSVSQALFEAGSGPREPTPGIGSGTPRVAAVHRLRSHGECPQGRARRPDGRRRLRDGCW